MAKKVALTPEVKEEILKEMARLLDEQDELEADDDGNIGLSPGPNQPAWYIAYSTKK